MSEQNQLHIEDLIYWLNEARINPKTIIPYLETHLANFRNQNQLQLSPNSFLQTFEGKKAWLESIDFLQNQQSVGALVKHDGLNKASFDHAKDLAINDAMGDIGSDGSTVQSRIKRHCKLQQGVIGETVAQEYKKKIRNHARQTILSLIISDGDLSRKNRYSIFNPDFRFFGVSIEASQTRFVTVITYSSSNLPLSVQPNVLSVKTNNTYKVQPLQIKKTISVISTDSENNQIQLKNQYSISSVNKVLRA